MKCGMRTERRLRGGDGAGCGFRHWRGSGASTPSYRKVRHPLSVRPTHSTRERERKETRRRRSSANKRKETLPVTQTYSHTETQPQTRRHRDTQKQPHRHTQPHTATHTPIENSGERGRAVCRWLSVECAKYAEEEVLAVVGERARACAGTTLGTHAAVTRYCQLMRQEARRT
eukprot:3423823-Rhodomonas_salina.1